MLTVLAPMSAATSARNVGCAAAPVVGPAQTVFALWVALVIASVPAPVIGEPPTVKSAGAVSATLVTVPAPGIIEDGAHALPFHSRIWFVVAPPCAICARASCPVICEKLGLVCEAAKPMVTTLPLTLSTAKS